MISKCKENYKGIKHYQKPISEEDDVSDDELTNTIKENNKNEQFLVSGKVFASEKEVYTFMKTYTSHVRAAFTCSSNGIKQVKVLVYYSRYSIEILFHR